MKSYQKIYINSNSIIINDINKSLNKLNTLLENLPSSMAEFFKKII